MENPSNFPLLRLPFLAIKEVLNSMSPFEIISFSKIPHSQCKDLVTCETKKYQIEVSIEGNLSLKIFGNIGPIFDYIITSNSGENGARKLKINGDEELYVYSEPGSMFEKLKEIVEEVKTCLKLGIYFIALDFDKLPDRNKETADWLGPQSSSTSYISLFGNRAKRQDVVYFLNQITTTENLLLDVRIAKWINLPVVTKDLIFSRNSGYLMGLDSLLKMKCPSIGLWTFQLTNRDLNQFLKMWYRRECHQNLKQIWISRGWHWNGLNEILEGIDREERDKGQELNIEPFQGPVLGVAEIRRIDGAIATVCSVEHKNYVHVLMKVCSSDK